MSAVAREFFFSQNLEGLMRLMVAQQCVTMPKGKELSIPSEFHEDSLSGGEMLYFKTPNGMTAWVSNFNVKNY